MQKENNYITANLGPIEISEIQMYEEKLRHQTNKEVVLIAYEKNKHHLD